MTQSPPTATPQAASALVASPGPLMIEVVRGLTPEDLVQLRQPPVASGPATGGKVLGLLQIRQSHHQLARLIVQGFDNTTVSLISGYAPAYISQLKGNPAFAELLDNYTAELELVMSDVQVRMRTLGLSFLDALQARLEDNPGDWTKRELMEAAELLLIKSRQSPAASGPGQGAGINITVGFVKPGSPAEPASPPVVTINGEATRE